MKIIGVAASTMAGISYGENDQRGYEKQWREEQQQ